MHYRDTDPPRVDRFADRPSNPCNQRCNELLYNWTNGRIWLALVLFWAVMVEVRLLSATNDSFQIVLKDASMRRVTSYSSPRYLMFDVCGDSGDRLMSLLDGLAFAFEANVSVVIPKTRSNFESSAPEWSLDDLIDVEFLGDHIGRNITIYRQAPIPVSRILVQTQKLDLETIPPRQRAGTLREMFDVHQVIQLACPRRTFLWTMPYHAHLRREIILGFRPPKQLETLMSQMTLSRAAHGYNCLAEQLDDEWHQFCHQAEQRTDNLRVMSWKECFLSTRRILDYVMHGPLQNSPALYTTGQNATLASQLGAAGMKTYSSVSIIPAGTLIPREMLDWYVCLSANISAVNSYSSLGFLQREARALLQRGPTHYYNQEATFCPHLLCKEEQRRWHLDPVLYTSTEDQRRTWVSELKVNGLTITGLLRVAKSCRFNFGVGWSCKTTPFTFSCSVDGKLHHSITASLVERPMSGDYEFSWRLPFSRPGRYVAHVWAHSEATKFEMDGSPVSFDVPGMTVFIYGDPSHHCMRSLYHLHHEFLKRFGNVSYVHPRVDSLITPATRVIDWREEIMSPRDLFIVSDASFPQDAAQRIAARGIKIVRWILEQPLDIVTELHYTGGILPLCSSRHIMDQYACPPKALIARPIAPAVVAASQRGTLCNKHGSCQKKNVVLIDHNAQEQASTGISAEQLRSAVVGRNVEFASFSEGTTNSIVEQYKKARVAVDLFVSGNEPLLLEAALFNVCPLVAYHGAARDRRDLPLPPSLFLDIENVTVAAAKISKTLASCNASLLTELKAHVLTLHDQFLSQVATFFSDNVLFYIICRTQADEDWAIPTMLALLFNYPLADIEIVVRNEYFFRYDNAVVFELLGRKSFARSITVTQRNAVDRNHQIDSDMFLINRPMARHLTTWILQWPAGDIALTSDLVQENVGLYEEALEGTDRMTAVIRRSAAGNSAPQFFFQQDLHFDMLAMYEARQAAETPTPPPTRAEEDSNNQGDELLELEPTEQPPVSAMRSDATADALGFLLLNERSGGAWRVGGAVTSGMCGNWARLSQHELWRSGTAFLASHVRLSLAQLQESCDAMGHVEEW